MQAESKGSVTRASPQLTLLEEGEEEEEEVITIISNTSRVTQVEQHK